MVEKKEEERRRIREEQREIAGGIGFHYYSCLSLIVLQIKMQRIGNFQDYQPLVYSIFFGFLI